MIMYKVLVQCFESVKASWKDRVCNSVRVQFSFRYQVYGSYLTLGIYFVSRVLWTVYANIR
jgi:hypothetical protein